MATRLWPCLTCHLGGGIVAPGNVVLVASRPAMGRTSLALNLVNRAAEAQMTAAVFTFFAEARGIERMLVAIRSGVSTLRSGSVCGDEDSDRRVGRAYREVLEMRLRLIGLRRRSPTKFLRTLAHALWRSVERPDLVVLDDLSELDFVNWRLPGDRVAGKPAFLREVCRLAKASEARILITVGLNRRLLCHPKPLPGLEDVRGGRRLASCAHAVLMLAEDPPCQGVTEPFRALRLSIRDPENRLLYEAPVWWEAGTFRIHSRPPGRR